MRQVTQFRHKWSGNRCIFTCFSIAFVSGGCCQAENVNLLANGGFETDTNGYGVADGWVAQPFNFSRQTLEEVQAHVEGLASAEALLAQPHIIAADGAILWERAANGTWPGSLLMTEGYWADGHVTWYERLRDQEMFQASRFGELPVPDDLDLGDVTLVLSAKQTEQVMSAPITVKPDTGYRLSFWVRTSGGQDYLRLAQVLDASVGDPQSVSPFDDHYGNPQVLNALPATYWWGSGSAGRYWKHMDLPFRTGVNCNKIVIRLPFNLRSEAQRREMGNTNYRIWYDDFRLVENASLLMGDIGSGGKPVPRWPQSAIERGFATAPRPPLPITHSSYVPDQADIDAPIRLTLAAGETDSTVIVVRNLGEESLVVQATPGHLQSSAGHGLHSAYGARFITIRAAEMQWRRLEAKRYVYTPKFLLNSDQLTVRPGHGGQIWMTVTVPPGTPAGEYRGTLTIARIKAGDGESEARQVHLPVVLTVRDMVLHEPSVAYFTWYHTPPVEGSMGQAHALPGAEEIYLADQRRHGMNTVVTYCYAERQDKSGEVQVSLHELDAMVASVRRAGLCDDHPMILSTWSGALEQRGEAGFGSSAYAYGVFAGGRKTLANILDHAKQANWPDVLFAVGDEPASDELAAQAARVVPMIYGETRKTGVRTTTTSGRWAAFTRPLNAHGATLGEHFDVWIEAMYGSDWPQMHEAAASHDAELWMYNCWTTGVGYLQERFYAGLWTWRTGAKGNGVWSYGWYVRINEHGLPESKIAWEGRAAGVNDYRYLQTLEDELAATESDDEAGDAVKNARRFLDELRQRIPYTAYRAHPGNVPQNQWAELDAWNPVPGIKAEDYDRIREECSRHIIALRRKRGL